MTEQTVAFQTPAPRAFLDNPLTLVVTEKGYGKDLSYFFDRTVYEIDFELPLLSQLLMLPRCAFLFPVFPPDATDVDRKTEDLKIVHDALLIGSESFGQQMMHWIKNTYENKEQMSRSLPMDRYAQLMRKPPAMNWLREKNRLFTNRKALILGAGDSLEWLQGKDCKNVDVFASWHTCIKWKALTGKPLHCSLVAHADWSAPWEYMAPVTTNNPVLVLLPIAYPLYRIAYDEFSRSVTYYNMEHVCSLLAAEANGVKTQKPLSSNVSELLIQSALYLGYESIGLLGVDCGWGMPEKAKGTAEGRTKRVVNSHKNVVYTNDTFESYLPGLAAFTLMDGIKRYNLSNVGLDLPGWAYKSLDDFLK